MGDHGMWFSHKPRQGRLSQKHLRSRAIVMTGKVCLPGSSTWANAWKFIMAVHAMLSVGFDIIVGSLHPK